MEKAQRKRLEELAASGIVGGDLKAALAEIDRLTAYSSTLEDESVARYHALAKVCQEKADLLQLANTVAPYVLNLQTIIPPVEVMKAAERLKKCAAAVRPPTVTALPEVSWGPITAESAKNPIIDEALTFQTAAGDPAHQAANGEWLQPTENPFGHGCCDCGLYHNVEWRLVDKDGNIVHEGHMKKYALQLCFTRNEPETARLREHQGVNRG